MDVLIQLAMELILLPIGFFIGGAKERRHLRNLAQREAAMRQLVRLNNCKRVTDPENAQQSMALIGQVVIATDYYKTFTTRVRKFIGGEMKAMQILMERARREAIMRLLEQAHQAGATEVWNVRLNTCSISAMSVEVIAYGTAVVRK